MEIALPYIEYDQTHFNNGSDYLEQLLESVNQLEAGLDTKALSHLCLVESKDTESHSDERSKRLFNTGLSLGMTWTRFLENWNFALRADEICTEENTVMVEVASGKGYLSRILCNHFKRRVICIDRNWIKNKSSLHVHRLVNGDELRLASRASASGKTTASGHERLHTVQSDLQTPDDLIGILRESQKLIGMDSRVGWKNGVLTPVNVPSVCLVGLNLCGDLAITAVKSWLAAWSDPGSLGFPLELGPVLVSPCCYHERSEFPLSKRFRQRLGSDQSLILKTTPESGIYGFVRSVALVDLALYMCELGFDDVKVKTNGISAGFGARTPK
ncbi:unnamed protein product [Kuraishia capsulata CBS 1993]|uniref:Methyltransferase domain-containing protein n=1 Tax=Kuraishia capsulata CBS 1993 TaxID=1382522 RepID=W6MT17_9ASCO|nr:uncharacterized protein KUCA_T00004344001 [Kuraishia capsulata CBS 1993]CDK28362.1 unnamed protein product [Kuraishia capsulata CBS 1993]